MPVTPPICRTRVYVAKELVYFEEEGINLDWPRLNPACSRCAAAWQAAWIST